MLKIFSKITGWIVVMLFLFVLWQCATQKEKDNPSPVKIIFDTDMGSDCDDVGALALLHAYADDGRAEILACIYSSGKVPYGAGIIDAINTYYGRPDIPIGAYYGDDIGDPIDKMSAEKLAKDTSAFGNDIIHNFDAEEQTVLTRRILANQTDHSVTYITVGHTKGIYDLLVSKADSISPLDGMELVKRKIKCWIAIGGTDQNDYYNLDWNFARNGAGPYTKYVIDNWPVKAVFVLGGMTVFLGKCLKPTPPGNIVRTAYRDWLWWWGKKTLDDQRLSWDLMAVYYAIEGITPTLRNEGYGWMEARENGGTKWHKEPADSNRQLIKQIGGTDKILEEYFGKLIARAPKLEKKNRR